MKILHVAPLSMNLSAGPTYSVPNLVEAQNKINGIKSDLLISLETTEREKEYFYLYDFTNKTSLLSFIYSYDIVVFHSTYIIEHVKIAKLLRTINKPYIIVPRGGFTKSAKNIKKWKKKIADLFIFNKYFDSSNAIHFLTNKEKHDSVHHTGNDFIIPNGINLPNIDKIISSNKQTIDFVFIGRIDIYHKGLDLLVESVSLIKNELLNTKVKINLYGPDVRKSIIQLIKLIKSKGLEEIICINDPVFNEEKSKILINADFFIQTSRFEGLPMGVLEALAYGLPCILTPGTNLSKEISQFGSGVVVENNPRSIANGILTMINIYDSIEYLLMRKKSISMANEYSWINIAERSIDHYRKIVIKHTEH